MATKVTLKITNEFEDETTRNIIVGPYEITNPAVNPATFKANLATVKAAIPTYKNKYVSESGANWKDIKAAEITTNTRTQINLDA